MGFFDKKRKKQVARQPLRLESEDTQTQAMLFFYLYFCQKIAMSVVLCFHVQQTAFHIFSQFNNQHFFFCFLIPLALQFNSLPFSFFLGRSNFT